MQAPGAIFYPHTLPFKGARKIDLRLATIPHADTLGPPRHKTTGRRCASGSQSCSATSAPLIWIKQRRPAR